MRAIRKNDWLFRGGSLYCYGAAQQSAHQPRESTMNPSSTPPYHRRVFPSHRRDAHEHPRPRAREGEHARSGGLRRRVAPYRHGAPLPRRVVAASVHASISASKFARTPVTSPASSIAPASHARAGSWKIVRPTAKPRHVLTSGGVREAARQRVDRRAQAQQHDAATVRDRARRSARRSPATPR